MIQFFTIVILYVITLCFLIYRDNVIMKEIRALVDRIQAKDLTEYKRFEKKPRQTDEEDRPSKTKYNWL